MVRTASPSCRSDGIACILPPHILWAIVANGDAEQRARALQALAVSERIRGRRELLGDVATAAAAAAAGKQRTVYDAKHGSRLPGAKRAARATRRARTSRSTRRTTAPAPPTISTTTSSAATRSTTAACRSSPPSTTERGYDNAFWDGAQMVFGDGDGKIFQRFTKAVDVIGHELTHGVTQYEASLDYAGPAGRAQRVDLRRLRLARQAADARADRRPGRLADRRRPVHAGGPAASALRSMAAPGTAYDDPRIGKDPQPADMDALRRDDRRQRRRPHQLRHPQPRVLPGGHGDRRLRVGDGGPGLVRHAARPAAADLGLPGRGRLTIAAAKELFGARGAVAKAVAAAWTEVGVL